jgi:hypothetical protein
VKRLLMLRDKGCLRPYAELDWEVFENIESKKPVMVTLSQPRNPDHHRKAWALAAAVARFHPDFRDAEAAMRWVKRKIPWMHECYKEKDGTLVIVLKSINFASMDQVEFREFYDDALRLWAAEIGTDPETLLDAQS